MNLDFELLQTHLELRDVTVTVPLPPGVPNVANADGSFYHDKRRSVLDWTIPLVDKVEHPCTSATRALAVPSIQPLHDLHAANVATFYTLTITSWYPSSATSCTHLLMPATTPPISCPSILTSLPRYWVSSYALCA